MRREENIWILFFCFKVLFEGKKKEKKEEKVRFLI